MLPQCYMLLCPCIYDLQHYGQLPIMLPVLFCFVILNRKYVKINVTVTAVFN